MKQLIETIMALVFYYDSQSVSSEDLPRYDMVRYLDAEYVEKHYEELRNGLVGKRGSVIFKCEALNDLRNAAYDLLRVSFYDRKFSERQLVEILNLTYLREQHDRYDQQPNIIVATDDYPYLPPMELWRIHSYSNLNDSMTYCFPKLVRKERVEIPYGKQELCCYRFEHYENGDDPVVPSNVRSYQYHFYEGGYGEITFMFIRRYVNSRYIDDFLDVSYLKRYEKTPYAHYAQKLKSLCETDVMYGFPLKIQKYHVAFVSEGDMYEPEVARHLAKLVDKGTIIYDSYGKHKYEGFENDRFVMNDVEYWRNKDIKNKLI